MRPLRQVLCRLPAELSAKIVLLSDVRRPGVIILALCGLLERAAHCIKRGGTIRLQPICPALTRPASLFLADEADHDDPLISFLLLLGQPCAVRQSQHRSRSHPSRSAPTARRACAPLPHVPVLGPVASAP